MRFKIFTWILLILLVAFAGYKMYPFFSSPERAAPGQKPSFDEPVQERKLLFAVVVENLPESRPQSGLGLADFVIETLSESGITRFLAFYGSQTADKIGPVRSARPYFVDWALGFGAVLAHSGVSKEAESKIEALGGQLFDLNEFFNEKTFWRDAAGPAPHNLFTSTQLLAETAGRKGWTRSGNLGWAFKPETDLAAASPVKEIGIDFSFPSYFVTFKYNSTGNSYDRFIAGKSDIDSLTNRQISAKNVIVLYTSSAVIDQQLLTINLQTVGFGRAVIFRDGGILQARWKKDTAGEPFELLEADDSLIELNPGQTWFAVVDQNGVVTWK